MNKKSGLELMRIVSMFFIILYHIILHGNLIVDSSGGTKFLLILLESFLVVHVNSFILLTGYFQSEKNAKLSKVISIINSNWFYKVLCFAGILILVKFFSFSNVVPLTLKQKIISILPLDRGENWYVNCYLLIYIFSPFLNILINKLSQKRFKKLIFILFIIFSIVGTLLIGNVVPNYLDGRSILTFILLYFVGAYLKKYPIDNLNLFQNISDNIKKYIFLIIYISLSFIIMAFEITYNSVVINGGIYSEIAMIFRMLSISFLSPLVLLSAVSYFLFFKNMTFNSKVINFIGGTTFGIYLLHENVYIRENIYTWLHLSEHVNGGIKLIGMVIVLGIIIFIVCMIIEIIRKAIFKFFYKRKFALKLRNRIKDFIKSLGLDIDY